MLIAHVRHVDDVVSEFGLDRTDDVALLGGEDSVFKGLHHDAAAEVGEVAPVVGGTRVDGVGLGEFAELRRIGLGFGEKRFSLLEGRGLVVAELKQNVARTAFFRNRPAVLVLFVEDLDFLFVGLDVLLEVFGRENDVLDLEVFGRVEVVFVRLVVGGDLFVGGLRFVVVVAHVEDHRADLTFFGEDVVQILSEGLGSGMRRGNARDERVLGEVLTEFVDELLVALALAAQEVFIEFRRELAVFLERVGVLHEGDRFGFRNRHPFLCNRLRHGRVVHHGLQNGGAGFGVVEHVRTEGFAQLLLQILQLLTLRHVELLGQDGNLSHAGDRVVVGRHAAVTVDAGDDKTRNNEHHGDEHQPALVRTECLKHETSLLRIRSL